MGKYYSEHELLSNMYDIVDEDGCILTVLDKDTLKSLPPLIPVRQPVHAHWTRKETGEHCGELYCSNCEWSPEDFGGYTLGDLQLMDIYYCPCCGAKMDER